MSKILIVAEKPSVGKAIAQVVGAKTSKDGYIESNGHVITWCVGHLLELAGAEVYDEKFKKWKQEDLPILPTNFKYAGKKETSKQLKTVISLINDNTITEIINATDAGREGELIFRLVYNHSKSKKPVKRLWISSLEQESISNGLKSIKDQSHYDNLYKSAVARQQADWIVGINATRLFSVLYGSVLNIGRVQTPTLNMVVERHNNIQNFKKEPFYNVSLTCTDGNNNSFTAASERFTSKEAAENLLNTVKQTNQTTVKSVDSKEKSAKPPELYDLTTLQREANRLFGFTAKQTLDYAQSLYEKKLLTYPRTDSKYITEDMTESTLALADKLIGSLPFAVNINGRIDISHLSNIVNNKKVSDHHALIPTQTIFSFDIGTLPQAERELLYLVCQRLLAAISSKQVYKETVITLTPTSGSSEFTAKGKIVLEKGYTLIEEHYKQSLKIKADNGDEPDSAKNNDNNLPSLTQGETLSVKPELTQGYTSPPKPYTEDTLLLSMEKATVNVAADEQEQDNNVSQESNVVKNQPGCLGEQHAKRATSLGTPATRAGIIEKLITTGFIVRNKKQLLPTEKGINLIKVVPDNVKSPQLTAEWEACMTEIEQGKKDFSEFIDEIKHLSKELVYENKTPIAEFKNLFPRQAAGGKSKEVIGKCPRCGGDVLEWDKVFSCANKECEFALFKESKYFSSKKVKFTKDIAKALLKDGKVYIREIYSEQKDKTYSAYIVLNDDGGKYVNFKLMFGK